MGRVRADARRTWFFRLVSSTVEAGVFDFDVAGAFDFDVAVVAGFDVAGVAGFDVAVVAGFPSAVARWSRRFDVRETLGDSRLGAMPVPTGSVYCDRVTLAFGPLWAGGTAAARSLDGEGAAIGGNGRAVSTVEGVSAGGVGGGSTGAVDVSPAGKSSHNGSVTE